MSLSALALKYRAIVVAGVVILMVWGVFAFLTMPRREDPQYTVRTALVYTEWPGAPAEKVEELVTEKLEKEINTIDGIRWIRSDTTVGRSAIFVEADKSVGGEAIDNLWDKVRSRVFRVPMPEPDVVPYVDDDFGQTNIMLMAVYQRPLPGEEEVRPENRYTPRQLDVFSRRLQDALKLIPGVAKVSRTGVREEAIYLETSLGRWSQLALTTDELQALIAERNVIAPGGRIDTAVGRVSVKPGGNLDAVRQLDARPVASVVGSSRRPNFKGKISVGKRRCGDDL